LGIKLDSFNPEFFKSRYHTVKENFERFQENLRSALKVYRNSEEEFEGNKVYRVIANMVLTHENKGELGNISTYCKKHNLPLVVRPVKPVTWASNQFGLWKELGNREGRLTPDEELVTLAEKEHNTLFSPSSTPENQCALYAFGLTVKNNGDVQICPDHYISRGRMGNIRAKSLEKIMGKLAEYRSTKPGVCIMLPEIQH
ncbi:hypothetical protein CEE44_05415, partial [Candidatus Woesearchaeota archaeon B3_Woes]